MAEKKKKGSETVEIWRSEIKFHSQNIKKHLDKDIKLQVKNIRKVGILGGIVVNSNGTLIDGHRRVMALDIINKYDPATKENDYKIKVERVDFDEKTEKEQMAYMALGNSKADYNLVANIIDDIDYSSVGISEEDYQRIRELQAVEIPDAPMEEMDDTFISQEKEPVTELDNEDTYTNDEIIEKHENQPHMTKEQVKGEKAKQDKVATNRQENQDLYVFLSFENVEQKEIFCELLGVKPTNSMMLPGESVLNLIQ